eukprot:4355768-Prymnesium_polylepis.1
MNARIKFGHVDYRTSEIEDTWSTNIRTVRGRANGGPCGRTGRPPARPGARAGLTSAPARPAPRGRR